MALEKVFSPALSGIQAHDEMRQGEAYSGSEISEIKSKKAFIETYGCQMNFSDTEIIASVLIQEGFSFTQNELEADLVLLNTCAIRENAETKVRNRLNALKTAKKHNPGLIVGLMGCMAERLKANVLEQEQLVDLVVGPDAYRDLPKLIRGVEDGQKMVNVLLSREETYADIAPVRLHSNGVTAFISIMRGCDNMCSFCVVPFTRGRERSRDPESILAEAKSLFESGYREVTLLGQNVDSYLYSNEETGTTVNFAGLLERTALISPLLRVRFSTSHPKDITDEVLHTMAAHHNICKYIHLPVQSGNSDILEKMNRGYSREWYLERIARIRTIMPDCGLSTDIISGFCSETEAQHQDTLSIMEAVHFDFAYMFAYSERPGTLAARKYPDDVSESDKKKRLAEIIELQNIHSKQSNLPDIGKTFEVLIEGFSKKSDNDWCGRNSQNKMVVFPRGNSELKPGDYVHVTIETATKATLIGSLVSIGE
jgi:tRNA-2-methylthio-N6-dimethylallyladenosine synthase